MKRGAFPSFGIIVTDFFRKLAQGSCRAMCGELAHYQINPLAHCTYAAVHLFGKTFAACGENTSPAFFQLSSMKKSSLTIQFQTFDGPAELPESDRELLAAAKICLERAHAPYSKFHVGAAILMENGHLVTGTNIENAAYPMCLCAEPSALAAAKSAWPDSRPLAMAISVKNFQEENGQRKIVASPAAPCGACRQILNEAESRYGQQIRLILQGETGEIRVFQSARELLPFGFSSEFL